MSKTKNPDRTFLAMDVGGTSIKQGLVDARGRVLAQHNFATRSSRPQQEVIDEMIAGLVGLMAKAPSGDKPAALALGMPGWINREEGLLIKAPNLSGWWVNVKIGQILSDALGLPAYLENDANLYALGEFLGGAGRGVKNQITLTLGTGVGGGLVLEGRVWNGSFASAAEVGHMPVNRHGALCGCGRRGCLETIASATGMIRLGRQWLAGGQDTLYQGRPEDLEPKIMYDLAKRGDPMSLWVFKEAGEALGFVLSGVLNLLGLEGVIIGGGAAGAFEFLKPAIMGVLEERLITAKVGEIFIVKGLLDNLAPLSGAAALLLYYGY